MFERCSQLGGMESSTDKRAADTSRTRDSWVEKLVGFSVVLRCHMITKISKDNLISLDKIP